MAQHNTGAGISAEGLKVLRESGAVYCYVDRTVRGDHVVGVGFVPHRNWSRVNREFSLYYPVGPAAMRRLKTYRRPIPIADFYALLDKEQKRLSDY